MVTKKSRTTEWPNGLFASVGDGRDKAREGGEKKKGINMKKGEREGVEGRGREKKEGG